MNKTERLKLDISLIRESINKKWALIPVGLAADKGRLNCALCEHYDCTGCFDIGGNPCPVSIAVGHHGCDFTPWIEWVDHATLHLLRHPEAKIARCGECRTLANQELMFLQRLLEALIRMERRERKANEVMG